MGRLILPGLSLSSSRCIPMTLHTPSWCILCQGLSLGCILPRTSSRWMTLDFIDNFLFGALRNVWPGLIFPFERYFFLTSLEENLDVTLITTSTVQIPWRGEHSLARADVTSLTVLDSLWGNVSLHPLSMKHIHRLNLTFDIPVHNSNHSINISMQWRWWLTISLLLGLWAVSNP